MQIKKPTLKHLLYFAFAVWVIFLAWYGRGYFFDEAPDVGRDAFYAASDIRIPDDSNASVGISGLDAPINADPIKYGRAAINTFFDINKESKPKAKDTLRFIGIAKEDIVDCNLPDAVEIEATMCTKISEVGKFIDKNGVLLKRYANLYNMRDWQGEESGNGQNLISINRLLSAKIKWLIFNKNYDEAYAIWRENYILISRISGQVNTMVTRAIFLVLDGMSLQSLEDLLFNNPEIASKYHQELSQLLKPQGLERYNIKNMLRADYFFFNSHLLNTNEAKKATHVEYMRSRFYRFHLDFLQKAEKPPHTLSASKRELSDKYAFSIFTGTIKMALPHGLSNTLINNIISGMGSGLYLVKSMHSKGAMIAALNLRMMAQQQDIGASHIQTFLNNAGNEYNCPFTERPIAWDAAKKTIYCNDPEDNSRVAEVRI